jgi:hypothetical protein
MLQKKLTKEGKMLGEARRAWVSKGHRYVRLEEREARRA